MKFKNLLERYQFEKYVLDICIATLERGGVTSKLNTYQFLDPIDAWGIPKYPDKTVILAQGANLLQQVTDFIYTNETHLKEPDHWLGTWIDPQTNQCYLDITTIYLCLEDATREAIALSQKAQRRIVALYDFKKCQTIYLWDDNKGVPSMSLKLPHPPEYSPIER